MNTLLIVVSKALKTAAAANNSMKTDKKTQRYIIYIYLHHSDEFHVYYPLVDGCELNCSKISGPSYATNSN